MRSPRRSAAGMTLLEIMLVMAVMALIVGTLIMGFGAGRAAEVSRAVNQLANTIRYGFDKSRVNGEYYRLLIDIDAGSFVLQQGQGAMYLPATDRDGKIQVLRESYLEDRKRRDAAAAEAYNRSIQSQIFTGRDSEGEDDNAAPPTDSSNPYAATAKQVPRRRPPLFEAFEEENALSGLNDKFKLPEGVKIVSIRTLDDLAPITKGEAGLYFFPQGRTQLAHIQVEDKNSDTRYTIIVQPLTGKVKIEDDLVELKLPKEIEEVKDELGKKRQRRSL